MKRQVRLLVLFCFGSLTMLAGCGAPSGDSKSPASSGPTTVGGVTTYSAEALTKRLGEYMPPLEGGQLEIATPKDWSFRRAGDEYLVGFHPSNSSLSTMPRILIALEPSPFMDLTSVTPETVKTFSSKLAASLGDKKLLTKPMPVVLGDQACAYYVEAARSGNSVVARAYVCELHGEQLLKIKLECHERQLPKYRETLYAVAAGVKWKGEVSEPATPSEPGKEPETTAPEEPAAKPDEAAPKPADAEPAAPKPDADEQAAPKPDAE